MKILLTGGAGYVGSLLVEGLVGEGYEVVVLDNLVSGHKESVVSELIIGDYKNPEVLIGIFDKYSIDMVIHTAASISPVGSVNNPSEYYQNNVVGTLNLLDMMLLHNVKKIIFSSSSCVFGIPQKNPASEDDIKNPITPYGESKLVIERALDWYSQAYGLEYLAFRYFNIAGASERLGSVKLHHGGLIPNIIDVALGKSKYVPVFGGDYPTEDGSCVRDYIHIKDIVRAYLIALSRDSLGNSVYNLGTGVGTSVIEVIRKAREVIKCDIPFKLTQRQAGDPAMLVADISKVKAELGWKPKYSSLESIIGDTWRWMMRHPDGYKKEG